MTLRIDYAAVAPDTYKALIAVNTTLKRSGFDANLLNLVYQRVSQINGCAYCVDLHGRDMRAAGEPPERLDGLAAWDESPYFTARAPDDVYAAMRAHFSELDATHLTFAVALMNALNRVAVGMRRGPAKKG